MSGEVPFPVLYAVFTQEKEGAARRGENEKERISMIFFNAMEYVSLEVQGQTWTGEENAGVQGRENG